MITTPRQQVQRLHRSNLVKKLHGIINNSKLNEDEKTELCDILVKVLGIKLKNITQEPEREEICVAVELPECCICMEQIDCQEETTSCSHKFHTSCIHRWCESNNSCPMCRQTNPIGLMEHPTTPTGNTGENRNYYYNNYNNINNYINNINNNIRNEYINVRNEYINRNYNENIINHIENTLYVNNYNTNMIYRTRSD